MEERIPLLVNGLSLNTTRNWRESDCTHHCTPKALSMGRTSLNTACLLLFGDGLDHFLAVRYELVKVETTFSILSIRAEA